jgi:transcriptional antiterminator RfaH
MNWYCVHTRPTKEEQAIRHCQQVLGVETYFPRLRRQRTIRRVRRETTEALFPRYFFCRVDPATHYRAIRYTPEVIDVVNFGGGPAIVPPEVIGNLKQWAGETIDLITIQPGLQPGDRVRITDGPLLGLEAIVSHDTKHPERVAVLLSILSAGAKLTINRSALELVA